MEEDLTEESPVWDLDFKPVSISVFEVFICLYFSIASFVSFRHQAPPGHVRNIAGNGSDSDSLGPSRKRPLEDDGSSCSDSKKPNYGNNPEDETFNQYIMEVVDVVEKEGKMLGKRFIDLLLYWIRCLPFSTISFTW